MDDNVSNELDQLIGSDVFCCDPEDCIKYVSKIPNILCYLTQNIRSINCNFRGLEVLLQRLSINCDIIILTECWLSELSILPHLTGYVCHATKQNHIQNDGVVIYAHANLNIKVEEPLVQGCNCLILKIGTHTALVCIYRSPSYRTLVSFNSFINEVLSQLSGFRNVLLLGDINIDIREEYLDCGSREYLNICASHGMIPAHHNSTHSRGGCLDHVIIKSKSLVTTFICNTSITDHSAVLTCVSSNIKRRRVEFCRTILNYDQIRKDLEVKINPKIIFDNFDVNFLTEYLINIIQHSIQRNSKVVRLPRRKRPLKPWITPGIVRCIRNRDRLHKKYRNAPNDVVTKVSYLRYRNFCNNLLKKLKRQYERNELLKANKNNKKLWHAIKNITNTGKTKSSSCDLLTDSSDNITTSLNNFNDYFVNVGKSLATTLINGSYNDSNSSARPHGSVPSFHPNTFALLPCDEHEVRNIIRNLKNTSAVGWDGIPNEVIKVCLHVLTPVLVHIFNCCFERGVFPDVLKRSRVHPVYKSGDGHLINNYRPISILPAISKILERLIYNRLINFLNKYNLISKSQYGFRSGKSTNDAILEVSEFVVTNLDKGNKVLGIFLDLAKAFDTVSIPLLMSKLERLGIRGVELQLFRDYLSNRTQCVTIGDNVSDYLDIQYGVPQGSILGPVLFLVYINDLLDLHLTQGKLICYADDTVLLFSGSTWDTTFQLAQSGFNEVSKWLRRNVLTLNAEKTTYITFAMRSTGLPSPAYYIKAHRCDNCYSQSCACPTLRSTTSVKYLGLLLDSSLSYREHIAALAKRVRKLVYVFKNLRFVADTSLLKQVYLSLCQSIISYAVIAWGGVAKSTILPLEIAQRYILKVCTFRPIFYPTALLYKDCQVLTVRQIFILQLTLRQHSLLKYDKNLLASKRTNYNVCPTFFAKHHFAQNFFNFLGPFIYNKINKINNIYNLNMHQLKNCVCDWLKTLSYDETELIFKINK